MTIVLTQNASKYIDYKTSLIQNLDEFKIIEAEWNELLQKTGNQALCLKHDWIISWLEHFPSSIPCIILVRNHLDVLVCAVPLKINRGCFGLARRFLRYVQFVGTDPCVYEQMEIPCLAEEDFMKIAEQIVLKLIRIQQQWDILDLRYFSSQLQLQAFLIALFSTGNTSRITQAMSNPYLRLPNKAEDYIVNRKKNIKKNTKNVLNRLQHDFPNDSLELMFLKPTTKSLEILDKFFQCHIDYWKQQGFKSDFKKFPLLKNFYKFLFFHYQPKDIQERAAEKSRAQFSILTIGHQPISYAFGFWQGKNYLHHLSSYNTAFKRYSPGLLHLEYLIQNTIHHQGTIFDLGRGEEAYKENWTQDKRKLWNLFSIKGKVPQLLWNGDECLKQFYDKLKYFRKNYTQQVI